jgi:hypothetical protein
MTKMERIRLWLLPLTWLVVSPRLAAAAPAPLVWADTGVVSDTTQPLLPDDAVRRMTAFLTSFTHEPTAVRDRARAVAPEEVHFHLSALIDSTMFGEMYETPQGVNMIALAAHVSAVAADLRRANLTPHEWEAFRRSLYAASVMDRMMHMGLPAFGDGTLSRNVQFLRSHAQEVTAAVAAGLPLPRVASLNVNNGQAVPALPPLPTPRTLSLPNLPANSEQVTVVPFQVPLDQVRVPGTILVSAEVDGHRGTFLLDTGSPLLFLNPDYLRPNPTGGLDTVTTHHPPPLDSAPFATVHTLRIGSILYHYDAGPVEIAGTRFRSNAYLLDDDRIRNEGYPVLGFLGLAALAPFETIIDYTHQRLILIRLDAAGHRLVPVPAYQPATVLSLVPTADAQGYGISARTGGLTGVYHLDTGAPDNEITKVTRQRLGAHLVSQQNWGEWTLDTLSVGTHPYAQVPMTFSWFGMDILGYPFLRALGTVGFNFRARQFVVYR